MVLTCDFCGKEFDDDLDLNSHIFICQFEHLKARGRGTMIKSNKHPFTIKYSKDKEIEIEPDEGEHSSRSGNQEKDEVKNDVKSVANQISEIKEIEDEKIDKYEEMRLKKIQELNEKRQNRNKINEVEEELEKRVEKDKKSALELLHSQMFKEKEEKIDIKSEKIKNIENEKKKDRYELEIQRRGLNKPRMRKKLPPEKYMEKSLQSNIDFMVKEGYDVIYALSLGIEYNFNKLKPVKGKKIYSEGFSEKIKKDEKEYKKLIEKIMFQSKNAQSLMYYINEYPELMSLIKFSKDFAFSLKVEQDETEFNDESINKEINL